LTFYFKLLKQPDKTKKCKARQERKEEKVINYAKSSFEMFCIVFFFLFFASVNIPLCKKANSVQMLLLLGVVRQDRKPIGKVCISVLAAAQLPLTCLISQVFKSLSLLSSAHSSPISLIKVRLTIPVQSQVGHTAFMLGHAHYSDTPPVPP